MQNDFIEISTIFDLEFSWQGKKKMEEVLWWEEGEEEKEVYNAKMASISNDLLPKLGCCHPYLKQMCYISLNR